MTTKRDHVAAVRAAWRADVDIAPLADRLQIERRDRAGEPGWRITGDVPSIAARRKAAHIAREVLSTETVEDAVRLEPAIRESDHALAEEVRLTLRSESALEGVAILASGERPPDATRPWIGVIASSGIIHLGGRVDALATAALAEGVAWETGACRDVRNLIRYEPSTENRDQSVAEAATTLIREHPRLNDQPIRVDVVSGEAKLTGTVNDGERLKLAEALCWFAPNIREVKNELEIAGDLT